MEPLLLPTVDVEDTTQMTEFSEPGNNEHNPHIIPPLWEMQETTSDNSPTGNRQLVVPLQDERTSLASITSARQNDNNGSEEIRSSEGTSDDDDATFAHEGRIGGSPYDAFGPLLAAGITPGRYTRQVLQQPAVGQWRDFDSFEEAVLSMNHLPNGATSLIKIMTVCNLGSVVFLIQTAFWWVEMLHPSLTLQVKNFYVTLCEDLHNGSFSCGNPLGLIEAAFRGPSLSPLQGNENNPSSYVGLETRAIWLWVMTQIFVGFVKLVLRLCTLYQCQQIQPVVSSDGSEDELPGVAPVGSELAVVPTAGAGDQDSDARLRRERIVGVVQSSTFRAHVRIGRVSQVLVLLGFVLYFLRGCAHSISFVRCHYSSPSSSTSPLAMQDLVSIPVFLADGGSRKMLALGQCYEDEFKCYNVSLAIPTVYDATASVHTTMGGDALSIGGDHHSPVPTMSEINAAVLLDVCCTNIIICFFRGLLVLGVVHFHVVEERRIMLRRDAALQRERRGLQPDEMGQMMDSEVYRDDCSDIDTGKELDNGVSKICSFTKKGNRGTNLCSICLESFCNGDELTVLPCDGRHRFHRNCIKEWLVKCSTCPLCQGNLRSIMMEKTRSVVSTSLDTSS